MKIFRELINKESNVSVMQIPCHVTSIVWLSETLVISPPQMTGQKVRLHPFWAYKENQRMYRTSVRNAHLKRANKIKIRGKNSIFKHKNYFWCFTYCTSKKVTHDKQEKLWIIASFHQTFQNWKCWSVNFEFI